MPSSVQIEVINKSFRKKRIENPRLSLRWLAQSLKLSAPMMTRVLKGERKLPPKLVAKLGELLDIDRDDQERLLQELLKSKGYSQSSMKSLLVNEMQKARESLPWVRPSNEAFDLFKAWYYVAILDATLLKSYDGSIEFLARRLKLDLKLVEKAVAELKSVGMLELENQKWKKSARFMELRSSSLNLESLRRLHIGHMEKAKILLQTKTAKEDLDMRLVTGVTLTCSKDKVDVARMKAVEFMQELVKDLTSGDSDEVYHFAIQLFPLT